MFRAAAPGPYDDAVAKATDENLTSEDWGAIMEVCDRVSGDANGAKEAVQSMIKRLAHRNANVQLYTLEVANALSQNCGKPMHRELSSRAFTEALLKLANDRNTHTQVKAKILERMKEWSDMFSSDPDLGIMYDAYYRLKQSNPQLQPPSAPQKNSLTDLDRQKEEEELQMALKLSLQDEERKKKVAEAPAGPSGAGGSSAAGASAGAGAGGYAEAQPLHPVPSGTTAATVSRVRALYDFVPSEPGELEFKKGDVIAVLESVYKDWWRGSLKGRTGIFPLNYVEKLTDPTPEELQREAQMEAEVFAEIKNVEKLLTLLSTSNSAPREEDNEEISKLYHQTLAIRPKLIKLIEKYSQKKDDFTQLNEKFIKARRDYEALLESSMSHPPQPTYHQYAMRPQIPQGYGAPTPGPSYAQPPPQQQDSQRFYTPAPAQEQPQYPPSSPSPNFQRPGTAPAPFYVVGAEVPPAGGPAPAQQQQYPPRDQGGRVPSAGKQPAPIQTSSPPPVAGSYAPYPQQPPPQAPGQQRPQSTYGAQELATSVYDSPIATHNPNSAATYSSSVYSPEDAYAAATASPSAPQAPSQPQYQAYSYGQQQPPPQAQQQQQHPYGHGYDTGGPSSDVAGAPPPPQPTGQAPPVPGSMQPGVLTPPPLQPGGPAYDARQTLPSQAQPQGQQPQYKAYVPPPQGEAPSAPGDYYRQTAY
ncbi:Class e vacuolar protein-sorting machinery protein hse1 [Pleurostoma richardsiae]|uniref:Class E vacuolar protein-sorting machinery protein HSE1 n=1 Tax=Pleurostoma richardsiae TaxID=41990 RepID=A0AA38RK42_9PEZI|nr:Class e vacuolar protein-sorting machinery protein hse1 [Pleurostoma richardsiae]